jgi:hypothetical protein
LKQALIDYYRCPDDCVRLVLHGTLLSKPGFFSFRPDLTCYGPCATGHVTTQPTGELHDAWQDAITSSNGVLIPFDPTTVVNNLRLERYRNSSNGLGRLMREVVLKDAYYFLRPITPESIRSKVQRMYFRGWKNISFPRWPIDLTVDHLLRNLLFLLLQNAPEEGIPFIWFWPDGLSSCAVMTHDVETNVGLDFCSALMDIDESWGIKSSFQLVPQERYRVPAALLSEMKTRGFEVNIHDLNHDGRLFRDHETFLSRVAMINDYARAYGAAGFRAGAMYRQPDWFGALKVSYDMSIPNSAHMEPQRGGCCTVMPFFVGDILELPLTTTQDWALFNVLRDYSPELWKRQVKIISTVHGMSSFIAHPDYLISPRAQTVYLRLLSDLANLRSERNLWIATPGEVDRWWRERAEMRLWRSRGEWAITGPGNERARIAYARLVERRLCYVLGPSIYPQGIESSALSPEEAFQ